MNKEPEERPSLARGLASVILNIAGFMVGAFVFIAIFVYVLWPYVLLPLLNYFVIPKIN